MNWSLLYYGKVTKEEVTEAIKDPEWQSLRKAIKGTPLTNKYVQLIHYQHEYIKAHMNDHHLMRLMQVRLTNYVTAFSRGGLIKPEDYRNDI